MNRRRIGRILGIIVISFWLFIFFSHIFGGADEYLTESAKVQGTILVLLILAEIVGFILNWKYRKLGATIVLIGAIALCIFAFVTAGQNKLMAISVSGLPFLILGILIF
ncbi:MAG: hypothetical protein H0Z24_02295 [Thermosipho sp. (in: Bacteria)]|nr:hypothetical protein [Thermosipho sp. (in: thermotogales)]